MAKVRQSGPSTPNPFKDYFGMEIPAFTKGMLLHDVSYHNDAGAFMERRFQVPGAEPLLLRLFVADPEDHGNYMGFTYMVTVCHEDPEDQGQHINELTIYIGNDEKACAQALGIIIKALELLYE